MCRVNRYTVLMVFLSFVTGASVVSAQTAEFPVPPNNPKQLFYLQRPANTNTLIYELNMENGVINKQNPIHVFWINYAENGQTEELNYVQRRYAYGVKTTELSENSFEFYLTAYKKIKMTLSEGEDKQFHAYSVVNEKKMILTRIWLQVKGGGLFKPKIDYVELKGIDTVTGAVIEERIKL